MSSILNGLKPQNVLKNFEAISQIPRGSGNEKQISDYLVKFGKDLGLETVQDEALNVVIRKPATKGYENAPGVVLQGHMDIVCEKEKDVEHDFEKDPIKLRLNGDMLYATGTTLGADNGIAVAMAMAILEDDTVEHPALEVLVTTNEETGMDGAAALDPSLIKGKYIINIDSEEEGFILVSCAGGKTSVVTLPVEYTKACPDKKALEVEVSGLLGGHSGMDIVLQKANANKLVGRLLNMLTVDYDLASIQGGTKHNAIPREANCVILVDAKDVDEAKKQIGELEATFRNEYSTADPGLVIKVKDASADEVMTVESKSKIIQMTCLIPHGVQSVSMEIKGLVESSTNFAIIDNKHDTISFMSAIRSSVISLREEIAERVQLLADVLGGTNEIAGVYPAWEHRKGSALEKLGADVYKELTGKEPVITALHAGLECGLLLDKLPEAEAISIGPDMFDVHTPNEHISLPSVENIWEYLLALLKAIK